jgi:hypothetical protein
MVMHGISDFQARAFSATAPRTAEGAAQRRVGLNGAMDGWTYYCQGFRVLFRVYLGFMVC